MRCDDSCANCDFPFKIVILLYNFSATQSWIVGDVEL